MAKKSLEPKMKAMLEKSALKFFHRMRRPLLLGEVSLWLEMQLDRTEEVLNALIEKQYISKMTKEELSAAKFGDRHYYKVVGNYNLKLTED